MENIQNINIKFRIAVRENSLETVKELINCYGLSYLEGAGYVLFRDAVKENYTEIAKLFLVNDCRVNSKSGRFTDTPLHYAVENNNKEIITLLLNKGANVNAIQRDYTTPLFIASQNGYQDVVELLLNRCANINVKAIGGLTPLHAATRRGHRSIVKLLLERGADVDNQDKNGETILNLAVKMGYSMIVQDVLHYCPNINNKSNTNSLKIAVYQNNENYKMIVEDLLKYGFCINAEDITLLPFAIKGGYLKIVRSLLQYVTDVNSTFEGFILLHIAVKEKHEDISKLLISYGADVNAQDNTGKTSIFYATKNADIKITNLLLTNTANVKNDPKLLRNAVKSHCIEIVKALLHYGADVNAIDKCGMTPLHYTVDTDELFSYRYFTNINNNVKAEIAKLLLSKGANIDAQTERGTTALHTAARKGYVEVVEVLLQHDADTNLYDIYGKTALHLIVLDECEDFSKLPCIETYNIDAKTKITVMLLNKGANVDAQTKRGITALHAAAHNSFKIIAETLLEYNANVNCRTNDGLTPLHLAAQIGSQEIIEILLKSGAEVNSRDVYGRTALHLASEQMYRSDAYSSIQVTLLEYGSDINITSTNNETPFNYLMKATLFNCKEVLEVYHHHMVKLEIANLYVSEQNLKRIRKSDKIIDFIHECRKEIVCMKTENINYTNISFYDILIKDTNLLTMCMRNENIVQVLKSENYITKFPIYASMIKCQFRKGMCRKELLEKGNKIFNFLFNNFPELPYICTEKILNYLNDGDLRIFINAYLSSLRRNIQ